jgi:hypothetical protein
VLYGVFNRHLSWRGYPGPGYYQCGYTYYARLGWVRTNASGYLFRSIQYGTKAKYIVDGTILTKEPMMASGTASNWTALAVGSYVPPTAHTISLLVSAPEEVGGGDARVKPNPNSSTWIAVHAYNIVQYNVILESANIYWGSGHANNSLHCMGWEDNL